MPTSPCACFWPLPLLFLLSAARDDGDATAMIALQKLGMKKVGQKLQTYSMGF
jgi:hypothetical protein